MRKRSRKWGTIHTFFVILWQKVTGWQLGDNPLSFNYLSMDESYGKRGWCCNLQFFNMRERDRQLINYLINYLINFSLNYFDHKRHSYPINVLTTLTIHPQQEGSTCFLFSTQLELYTFSTRWQTLHIFPIWGEFHNYNPRPIFFRYHYLSFESSGNPLIQSVIKIQIINNLS